MGDSFASRDVHMSAVAQHAHNVFVPHTTWETDTLEHKGRAAPKHEDHPWYKQEDDALVAEAASLEGWLAPEAIPRNLAAKHARTAPSVATRLDRLHKFHRHASHRSLAFQAAVDAASPPSMGEATTVRHQTCAWTDRVNKLLVQKHREGWRLHELMTAFGRSEAAIAAHLEELHLYPLALEAQTPPPSHSASPVAPGPPSFDVTRKRTREDAKQGEGESTMVSA
jgi:hypothetical protein